MYSRVNLNSILSYNKLSPSYTSFVMSMSLPNIYSGDDVNYN